MSRLLKRFPALKGLVRRPPGVYASARRFIEQFNDLDLEHRQKLQSDRLRWLLRRTGRSGQRLEDLPFTDKSDLRARPADYLGRSLLPVSRAATSGTSGEPLRVVRSLNSVVFEQASIDWAVKQAGHDLSTERLAILRASDITGHRQGSTAGVLGEGGRVLVLPTNDLSPDTFPDFLAALRAFKPSILCVLPSSGAYLADLAMERRAELEIPLVLSSSEVLSPIIRQKMQNAFNCRTVDFYGQAERVAAAYSTVPGQYWFLPSYGVTELVRQDDGWQVTGTNLHNTAQFLPRYRTGDLLTGRLTPAEAERIEAGVSPFGGIEGRRDDVLVGHDGRKFIAMNHVPHGLERYGRFQFVQDRPNHALVRVAGWAPEVQNQPEPVLERVRLKVPPDFALEVEFATALERGAAGKTPFIIRRF